MMAEHKHSDPPEEWITRVILKMVDRPHYAEFAIRHPLIHDPKLRQFEATQSKEERTG